MKHVLIILFLLYSLKSLGRTINGWYPDLSQNAGVLKTLSKTIIKDGEALTFQRKFEFNYRIKYVGTHSRCSHYHVYRIDRTDFCLVDRRPAYLLPIDKKKLKFSCPVKFKDGKPVSIKIESDDYYGCQTKNNFRVSMLLNSERTFMSIMEQRAENGFSAIEGDKL